MREAFIYIRGACLVTMKKSVSIYYSTYARTIISELTELAVLIRKYSTAAKENVAEGVFFPNILSLEQIEEALLNPQNSIKPSLVAYATIIKSRRHIHNLQLSSRTQRDLLQEGIKKLQIKLDESTKETEKAEISEAITEMENSYKQLVTAYQELMRFGVKIIELERRVIALIKQYDQEWERYRSFYLQELVTQIERLGVSLSELEKQELLVDDTWAEIISRFTLANTEIPDALNLEQPKFTTYFKLKAYWAINASLSRRMLPSQPENILKLLKKLPL